MIQSSFIQRRPLRSRRRRMFFPLGGTVALAMDRPQVDRDNYFIRVRDGNVECARYTRFSDGSAYIFDAEYERIYEHHANAWELALNWLKTEGLVTRREAIEQSLIPANWMPPDDFDW